jgi:hypothetical protein
MCANLVTLVEMKRFQARRPGLPDGKCILKPKIPIWVIFGGSCNGRCWYISRQFDTFHNHLVYFVAIWYMYFVAIWYMYFVAIWYILWSFGIFFRFDMLYQEKSGNPDRGMQKRRE